MVLTPVLLIKQNHTVRIPVALALRLNVLIQCFHGSLAILTLANNLHPYLMSTLTFTVAYMLKLNPLVVILVLSVPSASPTVGIVNPEMCCPTGFSGLKSMNNCEEYYHCVEGIVTGPAMECLDGTSFHNAIQNCDFDENFDCDETPCED